MSIGRKMSTVPVYNSVSIMPQTSIMLTELTTSQTNKSKTLSCFQFTTGIFKNNQPIFSPPFASHCNTFWQLKFAPVCIGLQYLN